MLVPGKYEDIRRSPVMVGAWILQQVQRNDSLHGLFEMGTAKEQNSIPDYSVAEITLGLTFLYACGLISVNDMRVAVHEVS